jgi:hypothetical protein
LYDPAATPSLFWIDARGRTVYATHGFAKDDLNEVSAIIAVALGQRPVIVASAADGQPAFKPG